MILLGRACWAITKSLQIETSNSQIKLSWYQLIFGPARRSWYMFLLVIEMYFQWGTNRVDGIPWREASNKQSNIHILLCINRDGRLSGWSVEWAFISLRVEKWEENDGWLSGFDEVGRRTSAIWQWSFHRTVVWSSLTQLSESPYRYKKINSEKEIYRCANISLCKFLAEEADIPSRFICVCVYQCS